MNRIKNLKARRKLSLPASTASPSSPAVSPSSASDFSRLMFRDELVYTTKTAHRTVSERRPAGDFESIRRRLSNGSAANGNSPAVSEANKRSGGGRGGLRRESLSSCSISEVEVPPSQSSLGLPQFHVHPPTPQRSPLHQPHNTQQQPQQQHHHGRHRQGSLPLVFRSLYVLPSSSGDGDDEDVVFGRQEGGFARKIIPFLCVQLCSFHPFGLPLL